MNSLQITSNQLKYTSGFATCGLSKRMLFL